MIPNLIVEMVNDARDEIDNVFKLNNPELSIIPRSQRETRDIINYALDRLNNYIEEEPELNEEAISKLCDDMIDAKKEPLSAAQIIDKYRRD